MRVSRKPFKKEEKLAAIELWRASVPLVKIRSQLGISKATLKRVLAFAKANPANPIKPRMPGSGKQCKVSDSTKKAMKKKVMQIPTITAKQLKKALQSTKHCPVMLKMFICVH